MEAKASASSDTQPDTSGPESCFFCGYNLRGLRVDGACPECGGKYNASAHELKWRLARFGPQMLEDACRLRAGLTLATLTSIGFWVSFAVVIFSGSSQFLFTNQIGGTGHGLMLGIAVTTGIIRVWGSWLASDSRLLYLKRVDLTPRTLWNRLPYVALAVPGALCRVLAFVPWPYGREALQLAAILALGSAALNVLSAQRLHDAMSRDKVDTKAAIWPVMILLAVLIAGTLPLAGFFGPVLALMLVMPLYWASLLYAVSQVYQAETLDRQTLASERS